MSRPAKKERAENRKKTRLEKILQRLLDKPGVSIDLRNYTITYQQATAVLKDVTDMLTLMAIPYQERHGTHEICVLSEAQLEQLNRQRTNTFSRGWV